MASPTCAIHSLTVAQKTTYAAVVGIEKCKGRDHLKKVLEQVEKVGGEGLMLRQPGSAYVHSRCRQLLKVKTFRDDEAKVCGYEWKVRSRSPIPHFR